MTGQNVTTRPVKEVIYFKRRVYAQALHELGPLLFPDGMPAEPRWWPQRWRAVFDKDRRRSAESQPASERLDDCQADYP